MTSEGSFAGFCFWAAATPIRGILEVNKLPYVYIPLCTYNMYTYVYQYILYKPRGCRGNRSVIAIAAAWLIMTQSSVFPWLYVSVIDPNGAARRNWRGNPHLCFFTLRKHYTVYTHRVYIREVKWSYKTFLESKIIM